MNIKKITALLCRIDFKFSTCKSSHFILEVLIKSL